MPTGAPHLYWIPLLPLLGAAFNLILGRKLPRWLVHLVACSTVGASCVIAVDLIATHLWDMPPDARVIRDNVYTWISSGTLSIDLSFVMDPLAAVMVFTITFVGFLIHVYSTGYMAHDPRYASYFGYLNLFTGAMLVLVLGDSLPVMFIGWEGVGLCSYLLIGFWFQKKANADAGRKAFVVNRIGDFGFILGMLLLWSTTGHLDMAWIASHPAELGQPLLNAGGLPLAFWVGLFLFVGACGKSAQVPLYVWLPDAMAGPTPVSALIHAATMVTAGVYMVARLAGLYLAAPEVMMIVAGVGAFTALFAAIIGFAQNDIKKVLAYSTVSQLGFMFVGVGTGAFTAAIFHLFTHAFFKAGLFLGAGSVMHAMGDKTDIMIMGGLRKKAPLTHATFLIYCLAIAGIVPFAGFFSKDEILLGAWIADHPGWPAWYGKLLWGTLSVAALGTAFYMWRLYFLVFWGKSRADEETQKHIHESPLSMTGPLIVLAVGAAGLGFLGLPHVLGLRNFAGEWLGPVFPAAAHHVSSGTTYGLMGAALVAGVIGIAAAAALYRNGPPALGFAGLRKVVAHKFYVDEGYELLFIRPFRWLATATFRVIDRFLIDIVLVNGSAFVVQGFGRLARGWQNGDVQRSLALIVVGAAAIFWFTTRFDGALSASRRGGDSVHLVAEVAGAGPGDVAAAYEWDCDGDGKLEVALSGRHDVDCRLTGQPDQKVTVWITDVYGKVRKVEKKVGEARAERVP